MVSLVDVCKPQQFGCPVCERYIFDYSHLKKERGSSIGPWGCKCCGAQVGVTINEDLTHSVFVSDTTTEIKTLVLLRLDKKYAEGESEVYIVVEEKTWLWAKDKEEIAAGRATTESVINDHQEYLYNTHTCPTNWFPAVKIRDGDDTDPHGIFQHVESVVLDDKYCVDGFDVQDILNDPDEWAVIFSHFRQQKTVEGVVVEPTQPLTLQNLEPTTEKKLNFELETHPESTFGKLLSALEAPENINHMAAISAVSDNVTLQGGKLVITGTTMEHLAFWWGEIAGGTPVLMGPISRVMMGIEIHPVEVDTIRIEVLEDNSLVLKSQPAQTGDVTNAGQESST